MYKIVILFMADPHFNVVRGGGRECHADQRRRVEGAASGHSAVQTIPERSIVFSITEIAIPNEWLGQGSEPGIIGVITRTAKWPKAILTGCKAPDVCHGSHWHHPNMPHQSHDRFCHEKRLEYHHQSLLLGRTLDYMSFPTRERWHPHIRHWLEENDRIFLECWSPPRERGIGHSDRGTLPASNPGGHREDLEWIVGLLQICCS